MTADHGGLTLVRTEHPDRTTLRNLAVRVVNDEPGMETACHSVVPLIAAECPDALTVFGQLVEGVRDLAALERDAQGYADALDWPTRADALDRLRDGLAGNVEGLLDQLTAGAGGVVTPTTSAQSVPADMSAAGTEPGGRKPRLRDLFCCAGGAGDGLLPGRVRR